MAPPRKRAKSAPRDEPRRYDAKATPAAFPSRVPSEAPSQRSAYDHDAHQNELKDWQVNDDGFGEDWQDVNCDVTNQELTISIRIAYEGRAKRAFLDNESFSEWYRQERADLSQEKGKGSTSTDNNSITPSVQDRLEALWSCSLTIATRIFCETLDDAWNCAKTCETELAGSNYAGEHIARMRRGSTITPPDSEADYALDRPAIDDHQHVGRGHARASRDDSAVQLEQPEKEPISILEQSKDWQGWDRTYGMETNWLQRYSNAEWEYEGRSLQMPQEDD